MILVDLSWEHQIHLACVGEMNSTLPGQFKLSGQIPTWITVLYEKEKSVKLTGKTYIFGS